MSPGIFLVVPYVIDDIRDDHREPAEHGDEHGHVGSLVMEVTKVNPRIQHLDDGLPGVLLLDGRVAAHLVHRLRIQLELTQHLLQLALAVPRVVGQADLGVKPSEGLLGYAPHAVMGQVEGSQALRDALEGPRVHGFDGVARQVQLLEPGKVFESLIWDFGDVIRGQKKRHGVVRKVGRYLLQVTRGTLHHGQAVPLDTVAALGTGRTHRARKTKG